MPRWSAMITMPDGTRAIGSGSRLSLRSERCRCGKPSAMQCDYPLLADTIQICDRHLCRDCAVRVEPNRYYCKEHRRWEA